MARKAELGDLVAILRADSSKLKSDLKSGQRDVQRFSSKAGGLLKRFGAAVAAYFAIDQIRKFTMAIFNAGVEVERLKLGVGAAGGSMKAGSAAMGFLRQEADRLGFVFQDRVKDFKLLAAAAEGTTLQGQGVIEMFKALTEAGTALQLTTSETSGIILAVSQMMSKGKITAEELRLQLAERLPGAVRIMAESLGVTVKELDKLLERGEVGIESLGNFAKMLRERFGKDAVAASKSLRAELNRLSTAWFDFKVQVFGDTAFGDFSKMIVKNLRIALQTIPKLAKTAVAALKVLEMGFILFLATFYTGVTGLGKKVGNFAKKTGKKLFNWINIFKWGRKTVKKSAKKVGKDIDSIGDSFKRLDPIVEAFKETWKELAEEFNKIKLVPNFEQDWIQETTPMSKRIQDTYEWINAEIRSGLQAAELETRAYYAKIYDLSGEWILHEESIAERKRLLDTDSADGKEEREQEAAQKSIFLTSLVFGVNLSYKKKLAAVEKAIEKDKLKIHQMSSKAMIDNFSFAAKVMGEKSTTAFAVFKGIEIAKTIIMTIASAQSAFASFAGLGPMGIVMGYAAAAAAVVAGMARVAQIKSMTPGGGGGASVGGGGGPTGMPSAPSLQPDFEEITGESEPRTMVIIQNPTVDSPERLAELMEQMRKYAAEKDIRLEDEDTELAVA